MGADESLLAVARATIALSTNMEKAGAAIQELSKRLNELEIEIENKIDIDVISSRIDKLEANINNKVDRDELEMMFYSNNVKITNIFNELKYVLNNISYL